MIGLFILKPESLKNELIYNEIIELISRKFDIINSKDFIMNEDLFVLHQPKFKLDLEKKQPEVVSILNHFKNGYSRVFLVKGEHKVFEDLVSIRKTIIDKYRDKKLIQKDEFDNVIYYPPNYIHVSSNFKELYNDINIFLPENKNLLDLEIYFIYNAKIYHKTINNFYSIIDDISRISIYRFFKKNIKSKFDNFYSFYDEYNILNCFVEIKNLDKNDKFCIVNFSVDNIEKFNKYFLYKKAINIAKIYHKDQKYSKNKLEYFFHLKKVDEVIDYFFYEMPNDKLFTLKTIAILHDIIEDTNFTKNNLYKTFNSEIGDAVMALTKKNRFKFSIIEKKYYKTILNNELSIYVKCADKIVNMKQTIKDKSLYHKLSMIKSHKIFSNIIYDKINDKILKNYLDLVYKKLKNA